MTVNLEPDPYFNQVIINLVDDAVAGARAIVPGEVGEVTRSDDGEREVNFKPAVARRQAGELVSDGVVASAPVMSLGGGGWSMLWPVLEGDEALGLAVDRNSQRWRQNREVGDAHSMHRTHNVSDAFLLPFTLTAAPGAPSDPGDDWVLSNTEGGERMRIAKDTTITLTKPDSNGKPVATFTMAGDGSVTIEVATGEHVNIGGPAAEALAKWDKLEAAIDAALAAAVAAALPIVPPNGDAGSAGFVAMQQTWDGLKSVIATLKARGE